MANTILQAAATAVREEGGIASEALTPGELVEKGGSDDFQAHSTAAGDAIRAFARAQEENQGAGVDDDIASGDEVTVIYPQSGDKVLARAAGAVSEGDFVESNGAGRLQTLGTTAAAGTEIVIGQANEAAASAGDLFEITVA